jgi:hypothetical protein
MTSSIAAMNYSRPQSTVRRTLHRAATRIATASTGMTAARLEFLALNVVLAAGLVGGAVVVMCVLARVGSFH